MRKANYIPTLDGWRAIAIVMVLICHGFAMIQGPAGFFPNEFWRSITVKGSLGVQLFFGISGFLICWRLLDEEDGGGAISLRGFYIRRVFRILPSFILYLIALRILGAAGLLAVSTREWWSSLLFARNYIPLAENEGWYTGHYWSLMVEEHFYLIAPSLLVFLPKNFRLKSFLSICLAVSVWRTLEFRHQWVAHAFLNPGESFTGRSDVAIDALFWGAAGALAMRDYGEQISARMKSVWLTPVLIFIFAATEIVWVPQKGLLQGFLITAILISTVANSSSLWAGFLEMPWLRWIGRLSYSLYIWNNLFLVPDSMSTFKPLSNLQYPPVNIFALFVVATTSYYLVEKPLIDWGRKIAASASRNRPPSGGPSESPISKSKAS